MAKNNIVKPGRLLHLESGEYSDRSTIGWFVCVQEFSPEAELASYLAAHQGEEVRYQFKYTAFLAAVLAKGFIAEVEEFFDLWHISSYSSAEECQFFARAAVSET